MPYLRKEQIEEEANLLLSEYGQKFTAVTEPPIPVDEIIELHLGLTFEIKDMAQLFGAADVHGALWVDKKVVGVDQSLDPAVYPKMRGRYRYTLAHEGGHWRLHRTLYISDPNQGELFGGLGKPAYVCRSSDKKPVERQANFFAANLLMPRAMVVGVWQAWRGDLKAVALPDICDLQVARANGCEDNEIMEDFCAPLAKKFEVSGPAMRIRLEELGLLLRRKEATLF